MKFQAVRVAAWSVQHEILHTGPNFISVFEGRFLHVFANVDY